MTDAARRESLNLSLFGYKHKRFLPSQRCTEFLAISEVLDDFDFFTRRRRVPASGTQQYTKSQAYDAKFTTARAWSAFSTADALEELEAGRSHTRHPVAPK